MRCEINLIVHATEDENKILDKLFGVLKIDENTVSVTKRSISGHFGNPIEYYIISIKRNVMSILERIISNLDSVDKIELTEHLDDYLEGSKLYLRLDKQAICTGEIRLSSIDAIRLLFRGVKREKIKKLLQGNADDNM